MLVYRFLDGTGCIGRTEICGVPGFNLEQPVINVRSSIYESEFSM